MVETKELQSEETKSEKLESMHHQAPGVGDVIFTPGVALKFVTPHQRVAKIIFPVSTPKDLNCIGVP
jgi:hypothetical protein